MERHEDCADECQIHEHKGYTSCEHTTGRCERLAAEIERLIPKAETGAQWAHICLLESNLVALAGEPT